MEIEGVRLITIYDANKSLIDVRLFFIARNGPLQALYGFDATFSKKQDKLAAEVLDKARRLIRMNESVRRVGMEASQPVWQNVSQTYDMIVPAGEGYGTDVLIGKVEKGHFSARVSIKQKKGDNINLEVPYDGDPGTLKGRHFKGELIQMADGSQEIAKMLLVIYEIK